MAADTFGFGFTFRLQDKFSSTADTISKKWDKMTNEFKKEAPNVTGAMDSISTAMVGLGAAAGLLSPFAVAINKSAEFGAELSRLQAISSSTTQELKLLEQQAKKLGSTTKFSATQAAKGMNFLAMAGFNTNQIMSAMPDVLNLATAGQLSLAKAADISSNIMSAFGIKAENMNRVTDVLAKTATTANVNISQIGQAMKLIAPQARSLGVSIEEVAGFIGLLGDNGIQGGLATASVRTSINRLANPTKKMSTLMKTLNLDFFDAKGKFIGFAGTISLLEKKMVGMTDKQKLSTIATIFGSEASTQFTALLGAQKTVMINGEKTTLKAGEALAKYTEMLENSGGAAKKMADIMSNNLQGSFTALSSQIETLQINIGQALTPIIKPLVDASGKLIAFFSKIVETQFGKILVQIAGGITLVIAAMVAWQAVSIALTPVLATFGATVSAAFLPVTAIVAIVVLSIIAIKKLNSMMSSADEKTRVLAVGIALLLGPIGIILIAFKTITQGIKDFQKVANGGDVGKGIILFFQKVGGLIIGVKEIFQSVSNEGFTLTKKTNEALKKLGILDTIVAIGTWVVRIRVFFSALFSELKTGFAPFVELWDSLKAIFDELLMVGSEMFSSMGFDIGKAVGSLNLFKNAGKLAAKAILLPFKAVLLVIQGIASTIGFVASKLKDLRGIAGPTITAESNQNVSLTSTPTNSADNIKNNANQIINNNAQTSSKQNTITNNKEVKQPINVVNNIVLDSEQLAAAVNDFNGDAMAR